MNSPASREDFPFADTKATQMLKDGLRRASDKHGLSTRGAARELGYKATVVISHMATGRVPIPLERAAEIAQVVGIDPHSFYRAVLEQRYPGSLQLLGTPQDGCSEGFAAELALLAGSPLEDLPEDHKAVIREVVSDRAPGRRWLSLAELPAMSAIREARPDIKGTGLRQPEIAAIAMALRQPTAKK